MTRTITTGAAAYVARIIRYLTHADTITQPSSRAEIEIRRRARPTPRVNKDILMIAWVAAERRSPDRIRDGGSPNLRSPPLGGTRELSWDDARVPERSAGELARGVMGQRGCIGFTWDSVIGDIRRGRRGATRAGPRRGQRGIPNSHANKPIYLFGQVGND
jgi:hypothetical protein